MGTAWAHWSTRAQLARGWSSWWSGVSLGTHGPLLSTRRCPRQPALAPPGLACGWGQSWRVHLSGAQPHFLHLRKESACPPPSEQQGQDYVAEQTTSSVPGKCSATRPALLVAVNRTISPGQKAAGSGPGSGRSSPRSGPPQRAYLSTVPLALARSRCWKRPWAWGSRKASRQPGALTETSQSGLSDAACDALQAETAGTWLLLLPHGAPDQGETRAAVTLMAPALDRAPAGGRAEA